jgi:hypothetical protein
MNPSFRLKVSAPPAIFQPREIAHYRPRMITQSFDYALIVLRSEPTLSLPKG